LCLLARNRDQEAVALFEELAAQAFSADSEDAERWPVLADCQLLRLYFRQRAWAKADAILDKLAAKYGYGFEKLAVFLPDVDRQAIVRHYQFAPGNLLLRRPDDLLRDIERTVKVLELFQSRDPGQFRFAQLRLLKTCHLAGQEERALRLGEECIRHVG